MVTIKDIAKKAGVSFGTVDRVLHNRGRFSEETAQRVRQIAKELGFTPNPFARNLSQSKKWVFGVLSPSPDQDGGYWHQPISGIKKAVEINRRLRINLEVEYFDRYSSESFLKAWERLTQRGINALLLAPLLPEPASKVLQMAAEASVECVCFDTELKHPVPICQIGQDSHHSGRVLASLVSRLISDTGRLAVLRPDTDNEHIGRRLEGIREFCKKSHFTVDEHIMPRYADTASFTSAIRAYILERGRPEAIIVPDATTHLVAAALQEIGFKVPLVGNDLLPADVPFLQDGTIDFLVTQSPQRQGELAVHVLVEHLVLGKHIQAQVRMPVNIVNAENCNDFLNS